MSAKQPTSGDDREGGVYEIRLKGHLDNRWAEWFEGLTLTRADNGETRLTGPVADQAALHGLLRKVRDLGLPLIAVSQVGPEQPDGRDVKPGHASLLFEQETDT